MPELVEHDGAASVSSMMNLVLCVIFRQCFRPEKYVYLLCGQWQNDAGKQVCFCKIFWVCCYVKSTGGSQWMYRCCPHTAQRPTDFLCHTVSNSWKEPLRQTLQVRLPGCLSNVNQDESICRGKYQSESKDDQSVGCRQEIFKDNGAACRSLM